jgi:WD40 repeat protein
MGLLQCPLCFYSQNQQKHQKTEPHSHDHIHSESSTSSSISSQPSLPSVPSLTSQQSQTTHHKLLTTINGHSSPIFSLTLHSKFIYSGSSNSEIRRFEKDPFALQSSNNTNNLVSISNGSKSTIKSMIVVNDMLFSAHQDHKIRVWKIETTTTKTATISDTNHDQRLFKCIATLPTFNDRFSKLFASKNYVEVRRHKKCTWVNHVDAVSSLAVSKDGFFLYSASWDRTFKIWRISDFKCLESVKNAHEDAINAIVVSSDGVVYTGSADKKIKIWKKKNHEGEKKHFLIGTLEKHKSSVNALALNKNGSVLYSGACDRSILVWEKIDNSVENCSELGQGPMILVGALRGHTKAILCLVAMDNLVCSGSADNSVRIWKRGIDEKSYTCLAVLQGHKKPVKCLAMANDSKRGKNGGDDDDDDCSSYLVYSGSLDCDIKVWQICVPLI